MKLDLFPTSSSIFDNEAVEKRILCHYDLRQPVACHFFRQGINDTYQVVTVGATYYHQHQWRNEAEVLAEIDFLNDLKTYGLRLSFPIQRKDGGYLHHVEAAEGRRYAVLFTSAEGTLEKNPTIGQSCRLGRLTAQIHNVTSNHNSRYARQELDASYLVDGPLMSIRSVFGHREDDMRFLARLGESLKQTLAHFPRELPEYGVCHGDLHTENVHFSQDESPTLFDCDCFGYGWRAYDLATYLWSRYLFEPSTTSRGEKWHAFLEGYSQERPLSESTLQLIPILVAARQLWVMGIHTGKVTSHYGRRWLNEKYVKKHFGFIRNIAEEMALL